MNIIVCENAAEIGKKAAEIIINCINGNENSVLGLATGASPVPTYKELIKAYNEGKVSFKNVKTFNLDEYYHLPKNDKNSYYTFMHENLFNHVDIKEENVSIPDGNPEDTEKFCKDYDAKIKAAGGIDIQVLGIGRNGHIGFNEPGDKFAEGTFKVQLTPSTIEANKIYFDSAEDVPTEAITMGTASILDAKKIILIATGSSKAQAIHDMIKGEVTPMCPASILQNHKDVYIFADKEAAALI